MFTIEDVQLNCLKHLRIVQNSKLIGFSGQTYSYRIKVILWKNISQIMYATEWFDRHADEWSIWCNLTDRVIEMPPSVNSMSICLKSIVLLLTTIAARFFSAFWNGFVVYWSLLHYHSKNWHTCRRSKNSWQTKNTSNLVKKTRK